MVHRDNNELFFTDKEQTEFGVPAVTSAEDAVQIAAGFRQAGLRIVERNAGGFDPTNKAAQAEFYVRANRAERLGTISSDIVGLCFDEQVQLILNEESQIKQ